MITLALFGGGRWSKVLIPVIMKVFGPELKIIWVTNHFYQEAIDWLAVNKLNSIVVKASEEEVWNENPNAAIIATGPATHAALLKKCISRGIATLSEKPFSLDFDQAKKIIELASTKKVAAGVNHEFLFPSYLKSFRESIKAIEIQSVDVTWHDPFFEFHREEKKYGDLYTEVIFDYFPHIWSILKSIFPDQPILEITKVVYKEDNSVFISVKHPLFISSLNLSRRGKERVRMVEVNNGKATLNFAPEPGKLTQAGKTTEYEWIGKRPLETAIQSFYDVIKNSSSQDGWELALINNIKVIELAQIATRKLKESQKERLNSLLGRGRIDLNNPQIVNLILDLYLSTDLENGPRSDLREPGQQLDCATRLLNFYHYSASNK